MSKHYKILFWEGRRFVESEAWDDFKSKGRPNVVCARLGMIGKTSRICLSKDDASNCFIVFLVCVFSRWRLQWLVHFNAWSG